MMKLSSFGPALLFSISLAIGVCKAEERAPSPEAIKLAKEILIAQNAEKTFSETLSSLLATSMQLSERNEPNRKVEIEQAGRRALQILQQKTPELLEEIAPLYANRFSEADLTSILAFYQSPAGRALTSAQPALIQDSSRVIADWASRSLRK